MARFQDFGICRCNLGPCFSNSLESVQHFALKIVSKSWFSDYSSLLSIYNLPTLNQRRKRAKMIQLYKEKFNLSHILESPLKSVSASPAHFTRSFSRHNFQPIHCRTSTLLNSFYPSSIRLWNSLPESVKSNLSLSLFKLQLNHITL